MSQYLAALLVIVSGLLIPSYTFNYAQTQQERTVELQKEQVELERKVNQAR